MAATTVDPNAITDKTCRHTHQTSPENNAAASKPTLTSGATTLDVSSTDENKTTKTLLFTGPIGDDGEDCEVPGAHLPADAVFTPEEFNVDITRMFRMSMWGILSGGPIFYWFKFLDNKPVLAYQRVILRRPQKPVEPSRLNPLHERLLSLDESVRSSIRAQTKVSVKVKSNTSRFAGRKRTKFLQRATPSTATPSRLYPRGMYQHLGGMSASLSAGANAIASTTAARTITASVGASTTAIAAAHTHLVQPPRAAAAAAMASATSATAPYISHGIVLSGKQRFFQNLYKVLVHQAVFAPLQNAFFFGWIFMSSMIEDHIRSLDYKDITIGASALTAEWRTSLLETLGLDPEMNGAGNGSNGAVAINGSSTVNPTAVVSTIVNKPESAAKEMENNTEKDGNDKSVFSRLQLGVGEVLTRLQKKDLNWSDAMSLFLPPAPAFTAADPAYITDVPVHRLKKHLAALKSAELSSSTSVTTTKNAAVSLSELSDTLASTTSISNSSPASTEVDSTASASSAPSSTSSVAPENPTMAAENPAPVFGENGTATPQFPSFREVATAVVGQTGNHVDMLHPTEKKYFDKDVLFARWGDKLVNDVAPVTFLALFVMGPVQMVNQYCKPEYRALIQAIAFIGWSSYLSIVGHKTKDTSALSINDDGDD